MRIWTHIPPRRIDLTAALALFLVALALRLLFIVHSGFDGLYGQDAYAYYDFAASLRAFAQTGTQPGPFYWPIGYPLLLALTQTIFGAAPVAVQGLSIILGAVLAPLVYLLARQLDISWPGALVAGLMMAVCGQAIQSSIVVMADTPTLALVVSSAVCLLHWRRSGRRRWLALAALLMAWAVISRYLNLTLVPLWGLLVVTTWLNGGLRQRKRIIADCAAIVTAASLLFVPQVMYSLGNPVDMGIVNHVWVQSWSPANAFRSTFDNADGHFVYEQPNALYYARPAYDPTAYYLAPVLSVFLLAGAAALLIRRQWLTAGVLLGWLLLPYLFLVGIPYQNIRFSLIAFPAAAGLAGTGADDIRRIASQFKGRWLYQGVTVLVVAAVALGLAQTWITAQPTVADFVARQQSDKDAAQWAAGLVPGNATLYTFGLTLTLQHYTTLDVRELYYETSDSLAGSWQHGTEDYLLLNVWVVENQWQGRDLQRDYHWLRDVRGLDQIGRYGNYTLFRVRG